MTQSRPLIDSFGIALNFGGEVAAVVGLRASLAFVLADGRVAFDEDDPRAVHGDGAVLCACAAPHGDAVLTGGDDGFVYETDALGTPVEILNAGGKWVEQIAASPASGLIAASVGKRLSIIHPASGKSHTLDHANTVQGVTFDPKGKRVAVARYNGVSLWWTSDPKAQPQDLLWKGSHIGVTWAPDGRFVVTTMQDNMLHGWRVADKADMRMAGYPSKVRSVAWCDKGRWLVTAGAPAVVCWPFHTRDGPMGKPPLELPPPADTITTRVAAHPRQAVIAAGYDDGGVMMFRLEDDAELVVTGPADAPVTALAFSDNGLTLGFGRADGSAGLLRLPD